MNKEQLEHLKRLNKLGNEYFILSKELSNNNIELMKLEGVNKLLKDKMGLINKKILSLSRLEVI